MNKIILWFQDKNVIYYIFDTVGVYDYRPVVAESADDFYYETLSSEDVQDTRFFRINKPDYGVFVRRGSDRGWRRRMPMTYSELVGRVDLDTITKIRLFEETKEYSFLDGIRLFLAKWW